MLDEDSTMVVDDIVLVVLKKNYKSVTEKIFFVKSNDCYH